MFVPSRRLGVLAAPSRSRHHCRDSPNEGGDVWMGGSGPNDPGTNGNWNGNRAVKGGNIRRKEQIQLKLYMVESR